MFVTGRTISRPEWERTEQEKKVCKALEEVAKQVGATNIQAGEFLRHAYEYVPVLTSTSY